jgi:hypothetical protein
MKKWLIGLLAAILIAVGAWFGITQSTPITKTKTITLTVVANEGSFEIVATDALQLKAGENVGFTVDVNPLAGFNKTVKFTIVGGPAGMTVAWTDNDDTWEPGHPETWNLQCNLTLPLDNTLVGAYPLELTGTSQ